MRRALLALGFAGALVQVPAPGAADECAGNVDRELTVFFGNGMFTTRQQAKAARRRLEIELAARFSPRDVDDDRGVQFELAYNESEPLLEQLWEVYRQRHATDAGRFWRWVLGLLPVPDVLEDRAEQLIAGYESAPWRDDADLIAQVRRYRDLIDGGSRVVTVAHSQGNLYANAAHDSLADSMHAPSFGIVSVANPDERVAGAGPHTTLEEDKVIEGVRTFFPATLPGNVAAEGADLPWMAHGFLDSYLAAPVPHAKILGDFDRVDEGLEQPQAPDEREQAHHDQEPELCEELQDAVVQSCAEGDPWAGTCVSEVLGDCWDPLGECQLDLDFLGTSTAVFPNGAALLLEASDDFTRPRIAVTVIGSQGEVCATGVSTGMPSGACFGQLELSSDVGSVRLCATEAGTTVVTCSDGEQFERPLEAQQCLYSRSCPLE